MPFRSRRSSSPVVVLGWMWSRSESASAVNPGSAAMVRIARRCGPERPMVVSMRRDIESSACASAHTDCSNARTGSPVRGVEEGGWGGVDDFTMCAYVRYAK